MQSKRAIAAVLLFFCRVLVSTGATPPVIISEFMADNKEALLDYMGKASDWIELQNTTDQAIDLSGWSLTDNIGKPAKWLIPVLTLPPLGTVVIWATGDDTTYPNGELHTNFSLSKDGEYLGLYNASRALVHDYAPTFPPQYVDIAYGVALAISETNSVLLSNTTPVRAWCPPDNSLGSTWHSPNFNDSTWSSGVMPVGYGTKNPAWLPQVNMSLQAIAYGKPGVYLRIPFTITNIGAINGLSMDMTYDDGAALFFNNNFAYSANTPLHNALTYNSFSTSVLGSPVVVNNVNLSAAVPHLANGENMLAVHLLNCNSSSSDLFLKMELRAIHKSVTMIPEPSYFLAATPNAMNGDVNSLRLPQKVGFSHIGGICGSPFTLTLNGTASGQTIRYTTNGAEPDLANSTLYTSGITISSSIHIRARIFDSAGRASATGTQMYTFHAIDANTLNFATEIAILVLRENDPLRNGIPSAKSSIYTSCSAHLIEPSNNIARLTAPAAITSRAGVHVRGSSSAGFAKKPYALTFWGEDDDDQKVLIEGFPKGSDFALIGCYNYDRTYIHDAFMFDLSRQMGRYAPRTRFVELFLIGNETNNLSMANYHGLYVLAERIRAGNDRLPINNIVATVDTNQPALSGSYILKADRTDVDVFSWRTTRNYPSTSDRYMVLYRPKLDDVTEEQKTYIVNTFNAFENAAFGNNPMHPETGVAKYIDVSSFVDFHLLKAFSMDVDIFTLSTYFHKDRHGKIMAGPVWDFDRSLGPYGYNENERPNVKRWDAWTFAAEPFSRGDFWGKLHAQPAFQRLYWDRWFELRKTTLSATNLTATARRLKAQIPEAAAERDYAKWGQRPSQAEGSTHTGQINWMINFVTNHAVWWDQNFTQKCSLLRAPQLTFTPDVENESLITLTFTAPQGNLIYYTLDGSDPVLWSNQPAPNAQNCRSGQSIQLTRCVEVFARAHDTTRNLWSLSARQQCVINGRPAQPGDILISEIHYHPPVPDSPPNPEWGSSSFEFVEIVSIAPCNITLAGCYFPQDMPAEALTLGDITIKPGQHLVVVRDPDAFQWQYGAAIRPAARWLYGALSNSGETITLLNHAGRTLDSVTYKNSGKWPATADGKGDSLHRQEFSPFVKSDWTAAPPTPGSGTYQNR